MKSYILFDVNDSHQYYSFSVALDKLRRMAQAEAAFLYQEFGRVLFAYQNTYW
jgi:hypothetical protein